MESSSRPNTSLTTPRSSMFPALLVLVAGVGFAVYLQTSVQHPVFFSGDGGMKLLMTRQFAAGRLGIDLDLPGPDWAREIWARDFVPFRKPFVYKMDGRIVPSCPLAFPVMSAPFLALLGWRGLYVLPFVSLLAIWWWGWRIGRRLEFTPLEQTLSLATLVFGSYSTVYSATFWEHLPAAALAVWGLYPLLIATQRPPSIKAGLFGGVLVGLSAWLRPECICLAAAAIGVWAIPLRRQRRTGAWLAFAMGAAGLIGAFVAVNMALYGYPLGAHSLDVVREHTLADRVGREIPRITREMLGLFVIYCPLAVLAAIGALRARFGGLAGPAPARLLGLLALFGVIFLVATILISPNDGGTQWGPRYLIPLAVLSAPAVGSALAGLRLAGRRKERTAILALICLLVTFSIWKNSWKATANLRDNYRDRILPALQYVQQHGESPVVSTDQHVAQELAWCLDKQLFFTLDPGAGEDDRILGLSYRLSQAGQTRFTYVTTWYGPDRPPPEPRYLTGNGLNVYIRPVGHIGLYYDIYDGVIRR